MVMKFSTFRYLLALALAAWEVDEVEKSPPHFFPITAHDFYDLDPYRSHRGRRVFFLGELTSQKPRRNDDEGQNITPTACAGFGRRPSQKHHLSMDPTWRFSCIGAAGRMFDWLEGIRY
jgi:hypothetical protein